MQELLTIRTAFILRLNSNISNMKNRQFFVIFPHARDFVLSYVCLGMCMSVCAVQCAWPWSSTLWLVLFLMLWMHLTCFFHLLFSVCFRRFFSLFLSLPLHNYVLTAPQLRNFSRLPYLFYWIFESFRAVNIQWMSLLSL